MRFVLAFALCTAGLSLGGCGGGSTGGGGGSCTPTGATSVTIRSTGLTPANVCVRTTGTVTFTNQDTVAHTLASDALCPEFSSVVVAANGGTANVVFTAATAKVCIYAAAPTGAAFQGTVAVSDGIVEGPGY
jgi:plastocyanin